MRLFDGPTDQLWTVSTFNTRAIILSNKNQPKSTGYGWGAADVLRRDSLVIVKLLVDFESYCALCHGVGPLGVGLAPMASIACSIRLRFAVEILSYFSHSNVLRSNTGC